jgi:hypothetical protein
MLSRLALLDSHFTSMGSAPPENNLDKYRKMSTIDRPLLEQIYYLGHKDIVDMFERPQRETTVFT